MNPFNTKKVLTALIAAQQHIEVTSPPSARMQDVLEGLDESVFLILGAHTRHEIDAHANTPNPTVEGLKAWAYGQAQPVAESEYEPGKGLDKIRASLNQLFDPQITGIIMDRIYLGKQKLTPEMKAAVHAMSIALGVPPAEVPSLHLN